MDNVIKLPTRDMWRNAVEIWDGYRLTLDPCQRWIPMLTGTGLSETKAEKHLREMIGIIPDFYQSAVIHTDRNGTIEEFARIMDECYGWGGFNDSVFNGTVTDSGVYTSEYEEDEDLYPLAHLIMSTESEADVECYIYEYGIVALIDAWGESKVARFD